MSTNNAIEITQMGTKSPSHNNAVNKILGGPQARFFFESSTRSRAHRSLTSTCWAPQVSALTTQAQHQAPSPISHYISHGEASIKHICPSTNAQGAARRRAHKGWINFHYASSRLNTRDQALKPRPRNRAWHNKEKYWSNYPLNPISKLSNQSHITCQVTW
jgi:hypothetical protein